MDDTDNNVSNKTFFLMRILNLFDIILFQRALEEMGYSSAEELKTAITKLTSTIQRVKDKIDGVKPGDANQTQVSLHLIFLHHFVLSGNESYSLRSGIPSRSKRKVLCLF